VFGAEAKAPFAKREARHHDSHRCREGGQHGGMSGQQGHGVGVGTWPAGPEGARPKNSITSNKNKASATSAMTKETVGVLHNKKITTGSTIAAIRSGRLPARTQRRLPFRPGPSRAPSRTIREQRRRHGTGR